MEQLTATIYNGDSLIDYDGRRIYIEKDVAKVRLTAAKKVEDGNGYDEGGVYLQYMRVPRGVNKAELAQALRETMGGSDCRHAYDCCGCASRFIMTKLIGTRTMQVRTKIFYNY